MRLWSLLYILSCQLSHSLEPSITKPNMYYLVSYTSQCIIDVYLAMYQADQEQNISIMIPKLS